MSMRVAVEAAAVVAVGEAEEGVVADVVVGEVEEGEEGLEGGEAGLLACRCRDPIEYRGCTSNLDRSFSGGLLSEKWVSLTQLST
jgi:hypothetical protein